jgi:hypothetical protein
VARTVREQLAPVVGADCLQDPLTHGGSKGLAPDVANYSTFTVTPKGLVVGLDLTHFSFAACGSHDVTVPWSTLQAGLNREGKDLVSKLR